MFKLIKCQSISIEDRLHASGDQPHIDLERSGLHSQALALRILNKHNVTHFSASSIIHGKTAI